MESVLLAVVAAALLAVIILLFILIRRSGTSPGAATELASARQENIDLQRRLAIEEQKALRIPLLENELQEQTKAITALSEAKNMAEKYLATATEGLSRVESAHAEIRTNLQAKEKTLDDSLAEKSKLEELLAGKTEALTRVEANLHELREKLDHTASRLEITLNEKSTLETSLTEASTILTAKTETAGQLNQQVEQLTAARDAAVNTSNELHSQLSVTRETLDQERKRAAEKLALLEDARDRMTKEFKILAADVMQSHSETFSKQNKEQIDVVLTPLQDKLKEFQQGLQNAHTESAKDRATLAEQIRQLSDQSAKMTDETSNLTKALKGQAQTQGAWGEMILDSILQRSGLREGEEYISQQSTTTEDGRRVRPDVIVNLPENQKIVIDSKLSLVAFNDYVNASGPAERADALKRHVGSIRSHIRILSEKNYVAAAGSQFDYVVMFVPIEGALAAALQEDPNITSAAVDANVAIATPTTLMIALRTVNNVWNVERRNRNAEAIAERAGKIYDKFVSFFDDLTILQSRLNQARDSFDHAMTKLSSGRGNLMRQVEQLKSLGAKTSKSLPAELLEDGQPDQELVLASAGH